MAGFGIAIVVGVLLGFCDRQLAPGLCRRVPADDGVQRPAQSGVRAHLGGVVRHWHWPGHPDGLPHQLLPIMVNIATGLATLEPELEDVLRVLGAKRWDVLIKVGLPRSLPYFYGSLKVAITLAFVGTTRVRDDRRQRRHWLLADLGRLFHANGAGLCRPAGGGRHGHGDVRAVQRGRKAHHRLGAPGVARGVSCTGGCQNLSENATQRLSIKRWQLISGERSAPSVWEQRRRYTSRPVAPQDRLACA